MEAAVRAVEVDDPFLGPVVECDPELSLLGDEELAALPVSVATAGRVPRKIVHVDEPRHLERHVAPTLDETEGPPCIGNAGKLDQGAVTHGKSH